jgi:hypothetical protein
VHHGRVGARWGFSTVDRDGNRKWFGGGTGGELSLTRDSGGPFRTEHGPCGADRDRLRDEFGVPVDLVDDVLAWWTDFQERPVPTPHAWDYAHREREQALWQRLRAAVPRDVFVRPADFVPEPVLVRMFVDDVSGIALWSSTVGWPTRASFDEETLPITAGLRARIQEWVDDYTENILGSRSRYGEQRALEHDRRGYALSRELQAELGDHYQVQYEPRTRYGRDAQLPRQVSLFDLSDEDLEGLPDLPQELRGRLLEWLAERSRFEHGSDETRERQFAWEDEGMGIRGELQRLWGPTFNVRQ